MLDALSFGFMQNALLAGLFACIACGVIGTLVVVNRIVFISGGIAHAAYGGIGLAFFLGISPLLGALGFSVAVGLLVAFITVSNKKRADTVIGVVWSLGMAIGIIFTDLSPGYNVDLMSYLFGSILAVPTTDIYLMTVLDAAVLFFIAFFFRDLQAMSFDEDFAVSIGVPVKPLYYLLIVMVALTVVLIIRVVGLILVIAMISIPPYIAERYVKDLRLMMLSSVLLNLLFTVTGLWLSYTFNLTSGAAIIMTASAAFFVSELFARAVKRQ
jgi:zinc transport system permease protein